MYAVNYFYHLKLDSKLELCEECNITVRKKPSNLDSVFVQKWFSDENHVKESLFLSESLTKYNLVVKYSGIEAKMSP